MKTRFYRNLIIFIVTVILLGSVSYLTQASQPISGQLPSGTSEVQLVQRLVQESQGSARFSYHGETGKVRFIGTAPNQAISQPAVLEGDASPEQAARGFLDIYGELFGLQNSNSELTKMTERILEDGRSFVRFQQLYQDVPVIGGELIVQLNTDFDIVSANGEIMPDLNLNITPAISAEEAHQSALVKVASNYGLNIDELTTSEPELWIYNPMLLDAFEPHLSRLVWRLEVTTLDLSPIREFVLVEAHQGFIVLQFSQIADALNRVIYDNNNNPSLGLPGNGPVRTEGGMPSNVADVNLAYDYSGDTYNFYLNEHSRDSIDGAGMTLISTVRYCHPLFTCPFQNARWDGAQMLYGDGYATADDVVGHELTHGVTQFTSGLFYFNQSGAINESLSDIWGEFVDQTNGAGTDTATVKWLIGEDLPMGAIRDMSDPTVDSDPDKMTSTLYYCDTDDSGGVHFNSGVNNKAAFLMTDGGSFNGQTVTGLGISKVADLYYEVQTNMLTSGSNYLDLYDALIQASINLNYSADDRQEIQNTLNAVEMSVRPCGDSEQAPLCTDRRVPVDIFYDDFETGFANWVTSGSGNTVWGSYNGYSTSGTHSLYGENRNTITDESISMTRSFVLPANAFLHFKDDWDFTINDGGVVEYSTDDGVTWNDAGSLFTDVDYNGTISAISDNPLAGRTAFVGRANGYTASRLDLNSLKGQSIRFRFRIGTNTGGGTAILERNGWWVDDVRIYTCLYKTYLPLMLNNPAPDLRIEDVVISEDGEVYITIMNAGTWSVTSPFWVDLYVNPDPVPTAVDEIWSDGRSKYGLVWGVTADIPVDSTLTLTVNDPYYWKSLSHWPSTLSQNKPIYVQVDSANTETTYGGVLELHELMSTAYNNIVGPVYPIAHSFSFIPRPYITDATENAVKQLPLRPR